MSPSHTRSGHRSSKALVFSAVCLLLIASAQGAAIWAQAPAVPKIAVVDMEAVFAASTAGAKLRSELEQLQQTAQKEMDGYLNKLAELEAAAAGKSPEELLELGRQQEDAERAGRRVRDDATRKANKMEMDSRSTFNQTVQPVFVELQKEMSFDLMLNKTPGVVIFAGPALDITEMVIERLAGK